MTLGSRGSGLDRFSTQRRLVPRVTYFYLRSVGARTYSPSIRSRIRRFLSGKGSKKGLLRATRIREFRLSVIGGGSPVEGGKHGHLKCRLGNEREKEGGSERKSNIVRGRINVRGSASGGQCFIGASFRFPFPFRPADHPAMLPRR